MAPTKSSVAQPSDGTTPLPGTIVRIKTVKPLFRADNLADKNYALIDGYNTPGRSAYLGVRWAPQRR